MLTTSHELLNGYSPARVIYVSGKDRPRHSRTVLVEVVSWLFMVSRHRRFAPGHLHVYSIIAREAVRVRRDVFDARGGTWSIEWPSTGDAIPEALRDAHALPIISAAHAAREHI